MFAGHGRRSELPAPGFWFESVQPNACWAMIRSVPYTYSHLRTCSEDMFDVRKHLKMLVNLFASFTKRIMPGRYVPLSLLRKNTKGGCSPHRLQPNDTSTWASTSFISQDSKRSCPSKEDHYSISQSVSKLQYSWPLSNRGRHQSCRPARV